MRKADYAIIRLALTGIMAGVLFPATLFAYTINGTVATLAASDRTADNTSLIQGLLSQTNPTLTKIIIPPGTSNASWPVCPLFFTHGSMEIHLNANAVLEAKAGGYPNGNDCVLKATSLSYIQVTGDAGSQIKMHKEEYATMAAAEWRHALSFMSCSYVTVSGLMLSNTGGDGIYLGDADGVNHTGYCSNVTITSVVADSVARNGLSVISADGLTVTGCIFKSTYGQGSCAANGPWAGIDLEPNYSSHRLRNIVIDNCVFLNNVTYGITLNTYALNGSTGILNITVKNCIMRGSSSGIAVQRVPASLDNASSITFQDCAILDNKCYGVDVASKSKDAGTLYFNNCYLKNNNLAGASTPFVIRIDSYLSEVEGNIQLNNVVIEPPAGDFSFLRIDAGPSGSIDGVTGTVYASGGTFVTMYNTTNIDVDTASNAPQSWWKLDETSGDAIDSSGNCDGTLVNGPAWTNGRIGGGLTLNGTNQFVSVADDASLDMGTGDFSIALWVQRSDDAVTNKRLLFKGASADNDKGYALYGANTWLGLTLCNGATRIGTSCAIPSLNQWHHMVFTVDRVSGKAKSYLNGVYKAEVDISAYGGVDISNAKDLLIGAARNDGWLAWPGKVDDVRIYKRVLTPGEIADFASSASACWRLDESSGAAATDSIGRSAGTLQNNPTRTTGIIGGALTLDGNNQFVSVSNNTSDLNIGAGDFSIALWMQRSNSGVTNSRLLYKGASADNDIGYALAGSNTALGLILCNGVNRIQTWCSIPSLNTWHHMVFTVDRSSGKATAYVNGIYQAEMDISAYGVGDISSVKDLLIGAANSSGWLAWPGKVDDVRIYKRVLSAEEVYLLRSAIPLYIYQW